MTSPKKEGLDSALDFTKFVITMDGALIAFVTGATFLQDITNWWEKAAALLALLALVVSIGAGILVSMATATKLSRGDYDLASRHLSIPGMVNVLGFATGACAVAALAAFELIIEPPAQPAAARMFKVRCAVTAVATPGPLECTGQIDAKAE